MESHWRAERPPGSWLGGTSGPGLQDQPPILMVWKFGQLRSRLLSSEYSERESGNIKLNDIASTGFYMNALSSLTVDIKY